MVANAYPTTSSMQLHATCTRPCIPLEVVTGISTGQYNLKVRVTPAEVRLAKGIKVRTKSPILVPLHQTCLVGP